MQVVLGCPRFQIRRDRVTEQLRLAAGGLEFQQRDALAKRPPSSQPMR